MDRFLVPAAVEKGDDRLSNCARKNVLKAKKTLKSQGLEVDKLCNEVVVDAAAGKSFFSYMENRSPCVTKARGGQRGFYFLKAGRYMNLYEIAGLLGLRDIFGCCDVHGMCTVVAVISFVMVACTLNVFPLAS